MSIYSIKRNRKTKCINKVDLILEPKKTREEYEKIALDWNNDLSHDSCYEISDNPKVNEVIKYISELQDVETDDELRKENQKLQSRIDSAISELEGY